MIGRFMKRGNRKDEVIVEDVEEFIKKLEDVLPLSDEENALVETVRWLSLAKKTIEITEKKMSLEEKIDAMSILEFLTSKEIEFLYMSSVRDIAELLVDAGETVESTMNRKIIKKIRALAFLTGRHIDEVLGDIEYEMRRMKKRNGGKK